VANAPKPRVSGSGPQPGDDRVILRYYRTEEDVSRSYRKGDFEAAREQLKKAISLLPDFVEAQRRSSERLSGRSELTASPWLIDRGGRILAVLEDRETLEYMRDQVVRVTGSRAWREAAERSLEDLARLYKLSRAKAVWVGEHRGLRAGFSMT